MPRFNQLTILSAVSIATLAAAAPGRAETLISGTVANAESAVVHIAGPGSNAARVSGGAYNVSAPGAGNYTIAPRDANTVFTPVALFKQVGTAAVSGVNFNGTATTAPTYKIAGTISGDFAPGAMITLNGTNVGAVGTDGGGSYSISGLTAGTYVVSASQAGRGFSKARTITLTNTDSLENGFVATATPGGETLSIAAVAEMPQATVGVAYSSSMLKSIAGGTGTYHYQSGPYSTGTPPLGMYVSATGVLAGTPAKAGTYSFKLCAADGYGVVSSTCAPSTITVGTTGVTGTPVAPTPPPVAPPAPTPPAPTPPAPTPPAPTPPPTTAGTSWVYYNGVFDWPGDYSFAASANYGDTSGAPLSGAHDIKVTSSAWGGWLPYALNWNFNAAPYSHLTFSLKPTRSDQTWQVYFVKVGDIPVGISVDVSKYGPTPVAGKWATYTVPLSVLGVAGTSIYKFAIQDQTGANGNTWYVDNVGFSK